ncbi:lysozyme [Tsuneonella troitsensis]|uniref:lysozyme n=1 Tax=Tsuneonella troitsensis TaxID=292222 RepID=UPI00070C5267|nr:lysozyme [Tsuneonella troitsensis]
MNRKAIFDAVRTMLRRGFTRREVAALDAAIDAAAAGTGVSPQDTVTGVTYPRQIAKVGPAGLALIKDFEGLAKVRPDGLVEAYPDPGTGGAPWTIGWGATGPDIGPGTVWTRSECDARLAIDVARHAADVVRALGDAPTTQAQFDALVSFHYNTGAIARATLTRRHRQGDFAGAAAEFARWNRAGGRVMAGLTRRREAEARLYRKEF